MVKNPPVMQEMQGTWVQFLGWEDPWSGKWQALVFWPGKSHGQRSLAIVHGGHKESDRTEDACNWA